MSKINNYKKKQLAEKIEKLKDPVIISEIFDIVYSNHTNYTKNANGIFIIIKPNQITNEEFEKINKILQDHEKSKEKLSIEKYVPYAINDFEIQSNEKTFQYTNSELCVLKRTKYNEFINNTTICDEFNTQNYMSTESEKNEDNN